MNQVKSEVQEYKWPEIGNQAVVKFLESSLVNNRLAQAYLFTGLSQLGKLTMALAFAYNLQGHPQGFNSDLHILEPAEGQKSISIDDARKFIKTLNLSSFMNSYKIGIVKDADLLSPGAQSALLKTLEEPQEKVIIILIAQDENSLPATILSRTQILYFYPVPAAMIYDYLITTYQTDRSLAKSLSNLVLGRPLLALKLLADPETYKAYLERAEAWLSLVGLSLDERSLVLDQIFKDKTWSKQALKSAQDILFMAEGLARDLLLLAEGNEDLIQHSVLLPALKKNLALLSQNEQKDPFPAIFQELKLIASAREYLMANVNPRLVLDQIVINF